MLKTLVQPSKRVLIADDDPVIRQLVSSIVSRDEYSVVTVNDGDEAHKLLQRDADFSAAIFDMMMPGLKGIDILRYMKAEKRLLRIPVMMITSEKDLKLMTELFAAGATAILPKPFSTLQLQSMLQMLISQRQKNFGPLSKYPMMGYQRGIAIRT